MNFKTTIIRAGEKTLRYSKQEETRTVLNTALLISAQWRPTTRSYKLNSSHQGYFKQIDTLEGYWLKKEKKTTKKF